MFKHQLWKSANHFELLLTVAIRATSQPEISWAVKKYIPSMTVLPCKSLTQIKIFFVLFFTNKH